MSSPRHPHSLSEEDLLLPPRKSSNESATDRDLERADHYYAASSLSFEEEQAAAKHQFIRNIYALLLCQLLFTLAVCLIFTLVRPIQQYVQRNRPFFWTTFGLALAALLCMICFSAELRKYPRNLVALVLFTLVESLFLGVTCAYHSAQNVLIAVGMTCVVAGGLSAFGWQTRFDFSGMAPYLFVLFLLTLCFAILAACLRSTALTVLYITLGIGVFAAYLVYDTQMMVNGTHAYIFGYDEVSMGKMTFKIGRFG